MIDTGFFPHHNVLIQFGVCKESYSERMKMNTCSMEREPIQAERQIREISCAPELLTLEME